MGLWHSGLQVPILKNASRFHFSCLIVRQKVLCCEECALAYSVICWTELQVTAWRRHCFQRRLWLCYTILQPAEILREKKGVQLPPTSILLSMLESDSYGNLPASLSWSPHEILTPRSPSAAAAAGLQCQSSCSNSCVTGVVRSMEDTSCDTSFAVDCTLSLGTAASRPDIPAQLSRSGSPALDPAWQRCSTSEQVDAATLRTHVEDRSEQIISWTSSSGCSNPNLLQEFYPQVRKTPWKWPVLVMSLTVTISITLISFYLEYSKEECWHKAATTYARQCWHL